MTNTAVPLAAALFSPGQALLVAVIVLAITLMSISRSRRRRDPQVSPHGMARNQIIRVNEQKALQTDIADLTMQLQQFARETTAQLDGKLTRLERAIADADRRIHSLGQLLNTSTGKAVLDVIVGDDPPQAVGRVRATSENVCSPDQVMTLRATGRSGIEIARELGRSVEEVELTLAVHDWRNGAAA
ncbi:MAG: hypothetical protein HOP29_13960 [Phycisphaerales bacterium]|nr:hypothetical protein [Phycisphaerales bacterium]